jgi:hypothetical protein
MSIFKTMKFRAAIFASIIAILTIQPAFSKNPFGNFDAKNSCADMCHMKKKCSKGSNKENKDCSSSGCNPFMPCATGNFFLNEKPYDQNNPVLAFSQEKIISNDKVVSSYIADCWHPPESSIS